ncbi:MAG: aquaporin [Patescibacteria group bacterium]
MFKKYLAEFIGTFTLAFAVLVALAFTGALPIGVPLIAGLVVGVFVYTIGSISGTHLNPSVTIGLYSVKKISLYDAINYIIAQILGASFAILVAYLYGISSPISPDDFSWVAFVAEMIGAFILNFGIASVVYGRVSDIASGLVIGGSLSLGIIIASLSGANGILNPAVALTLNSLSLVYILAPIVGSIGAYQVYKYISENK